LNTCKKINHLYMSIIRIFEEEYDKIRCSNILRSLITKEKSMEK
jgi:hypothetical protein